MSEALGDRSTYRQAALADYRAQYASVGASPAIVDGMVEMARGAGGRACTRRRDGRAYGTTFREWCESVLAPAVTRPRG